MRQSFITNLAHTVKKVFTKENNGQFEEVWSKIGEEKG